MPLNLTKLVALVAISLCLATGAVAQEPGQPAPGQELAHWFQQAGNAYNRGDVEAWVEATEHLHRLRPYNQDFMRHLVQGYSRIGDLSKAFDMMLRMQQQGLSERWDEIDDVAPLREHGLYEHLNNLMTEAGQPFGEISEWGSIEGSKAMPEALAMDPESERMFVGTVHDGRILVSKNGKDWEDFADPEQLPQLQAVFDLQVDEERGHLWVATGDIPHFRGPSREDGVRSALLRLSLDTGELQREFTLSTGGRRNLLGSLVLASDGTVFATDMQAPMIYRLPPDADELEPYFGHQNFTSLRGIALSGDDRLLYVADYELGIFVIDAQDGGNAWKLAVPDNLNEGGIDGLYWWNNHLVAIQNMISPQRVIRLGLGEDGLGVTAVAPIAAARPEFDVPTFGVMNGQELYFLAVSHWPHVDSQGKARGTLPDVPIMKIDVDAASIQVVGQEILEQLQRQQRQPEQ